MVLNFRALIKSFGSRHTFWVVVGILAIFCVLIAIAGKRAGRDAEYHHDKQQIMRELGIYKSSGRP
jgi:hypothetical protein